MNKYETEALLNQYLLFHYGKERDQLAFHFGPKNALNFPVRCVTECLDRKALPSVFKALELGCSVGRSSFELTRYAKEVVAVDSSHAFITAALHLQQKGQLAYTLPEGGKSVKRIAKLPENIAPDRVQFKCCNVMELFHKPKPFHLVLAANLLCRLPDPKTFLKHIHTLVKPGGQLILTSPYSWSETFTPKKNWITLNGLQQSLKEHFHLIRSFDMPFLLREHQRLYQWGVAEASLWRSY